MMLDSDFPTGIKRIIWKDLIHNLALQIFNSKMLSSPLFKKILLPKELNYIDQLNMNKKTTNNDTL